MHLGARRLAVASVFLVLLAGTSGCGGGAAGGDAASTDAALLALVPSVGALSPEFDPGATSYTLGLVATPELRWTATARAEGATISVQGAAVTSGELSPPIPLPVGPSSLSIVVTAPDGVTRRTYTVALDRTSAELSDLTTTAGPLFPRFGADPSYVVGPLLGTETATVTPTVLDPRATVTVNGVAVPSGQPSAALTLGMGDTVVSVLVTAGDGLTVAIYTLKLIRTSPALSSLTISQGSFTPAFDPALTAYGMGPTVLGPTVRVTPTAEAPNATIQVNGVVVDSGVESAPLPLAFGASQVTVVVRAAGDLATRTYTIAIDRTSTSLTGVTASAGDLVPAFSEETYAYVVEGGIAAAGTTVTAATADPGASLSIDGAETVSGVPSAEISLAPGVNPVTVTVTARDGSQASYTLVVRRALAAQEAFLTGTAAEGLSNYAGTRVALDGDTLAVSDLLGDGTGSHPGWVYVYVRVGATWIQQAKLTASNAGGGDWFGRSVSLSGDTLLVGASREDSGATGVGGDESDEGAKDSGAAYVFVRNGTTWSQQAYLKASNTGAGDWFGHAVAVSGDTAVVGAYWEDSEASGVNGDQGDGSSGNRGAAYVFVRSGTTWSQEAYLKPSNAQVSFGFGYAVSIAGDTVVVGAWWESNGAKGVNGSQNDGGAAQSGAAYVFVRDGTTWSQQAYLKAWNTQAGDGFGCSVAVSGDTVVVGALDEDSDVTGVDGTADNTNRPGSGAAYVFVRSGTAWSQQAYLKASNTGSNDGFGVSVGISRDVIVVGAQFESSAATGLDGDQSDDSVSRTGAAYVFARTGTTWAQAAYVKAPSNGAGRSFGVATAVSGDTVAALGAVASSGLALYR